MDKDAHVCPICARSFTRRHNMLQHIRCIHNGRRDHVCDVCGRGFNRKSNLHRHVRGCKMECKLIVWSVNISAVFSGYVAATEFVYGVYSISGVADRRTVRDATVGEEAMKMVYAGPKVREGRVLFFFS